MNDLGIDRVTPHEVGTELRWSKVTGPDAVKIIDRDWIRYLRILILFVAVVLTWLVVNWQESKFDSAASNAALNMARTTRSIPDASTTIRPIILPTVRQPTAVDAQPGDQLQAPSPAVEVSPQEPADTAGSPGGPREYVVKSGDTLGAIAASVSVPIEALMAVNGITNPDQIQVGQVLTVPNPSRGTGQGPAATPQTYTVAQGDTLAAIAARFGVDVDELARTNGIADPDSIIIGQVLRIP
ncbi:MAG: LysM peptidoglycan-binding domain-containing protein [Chloroflexi bacterium]|nr:LysM peptidoglycan-binding domain-containing protein [Chloroflexota bacterium]MCY3937207.1 LysM peptidoglycan-binding domain-containing protein [Chloroflexota bacterium]